MSVKRILVVDDSSLYQRLLSDVIDGQAGLEVVGVASNGKIALSMMHKTQPDLVTLDILMPEMDGIQTLMELGKKWPSVKKIMISSLTTEGSDAASDVLALGANGVVVKPGSRGGTDTIRDELVKDLLPKIKLLCGSTVLAKASSSTSSKSTLPGTQYPTKSPTPDVQIPLAVSESDDALEDIGLVAIGVSTGGPDALATLLSQLPASISVPIVIVQHMPAEFTAKLARRLDAASALHVVEAQQGDKLCAGTVYIAPGDYHMVLDQVGSDVMVNVNREEPENSCRPSVDPLFRSIPAIFGSRCLGIIMTGMGADGLRGCEVLHSAGCPILVQDKLTSVVWGMPKLVALAGLAQRQVPLDQMADAITIFLDKASGTLSRAAANSDMYKQTTIAGRRS